MSQCVSGRDLDDGPSHHLQVQHRSSATTRLAMSDYEVAELTWENGHLAMHGHRGGPARVGKPSSWGKPRASGTLEAVVDQATRPALPAATHWHKSAGSHFVHCRGAAANNAPVRANLPVPAVADALVPCSNLHTHCSEESHPIHIVPDAAPAGPGDGGGTCVGSCSGRKRTRLGGAVDGNCSATGSAASMGLTFDTCEINGGDDDAGFATSASPVDGSAETENTSCGRPLTHAEDHDSVCHSRRTQAISLKSHKPHSAFLPPPLSSLSSSHMSSQNMAAALLRQRDGCYEEEKNKGETGRSFVSTKRSRAAVIHNQSERKRRDRINQKMKTLQKLVPNSSKTDKASILDEAIEYLKQLQAQVQVMSRMSSVPHMMMPMTMQHMHMAIMAQMAQMAQMGMGVRGMGMMDMNSTLGARAEQSGVAPAVLPPAVFLPVSGSWDVPAGDRLPPPASAALPADPFAAFMACQNQPTAADAYGRMAALYRQLYQQPPGHNAMT